MIGKADGDVSWSSERVSTAETNRLEKDIVLAVDNAAEGSQLSEHKIQGVSDLIVHRRL